MVGAFRCPVCGKPSTQFCKGCQTPYCNLHEFRHPNCSEGR